MLFEKNIPKEEINKNDFSVYKAILNISEVFKIDSERFLLLSEKINKIVIILIVNFLFSSILFSSPTSSTNKIISLVFSLGLLYGLSYLIEFISERFYKPEFYDRRKMNLANIIDKVSGPNNNFDILHSKDFEIRKSIEYHIRVLFITAIIIFVLSILTAFFIEYSNFLNIKMNSDILKNGLLSFLTYFFVLFFSIRFSFSVKNKGIGYYVYGLMFLIFTSILLYLIILNYTSLFFSS